MDKDFFVQNIKNICKLRGTKPTVACRESGAGANLINNLEARGSIPSVEKVQLLAEHLGVTTSELLGEVPMGAYSGIKVPLEMAASQNLSAIEQALLHSFRQLNEDGQRRVADYSNDLLASGRYPLDGGDEKLA